MPTLPRSASGRTFERTNDGMNEGRDVKAPFRGYSSPNYTPVPDELFDEQLPDLSGAELKVLLYVIRRTFGFKRESDTISLSQMLNGLRTRDGRVLDRGVGLSKKTLLQAIKSLEEQAIILTERRRSPEKGDEPTSYRLNVRSQGGVEETPPPVGEKVHHGGGGETSPGGWGRNSPTQETVRQQTDFDLSKFERSRDNVLTEKPDVQDQDHLSQAETAEQPRQSGGGDPQLLSEILHTRALSKGRSTHAANDWSAGEATPRRSPSSRQPERVDVDPEARERLRAFLADFAVELGDEAPLASTITRTLNIFTAANVPPERWGDYLYQARGLTQEHTAQIRKVATGEAPVRRKNKMPYFLATLEQLVGLRPDPNPRAGASATSSPRRS